VKSMESAMNELSRRHFLRSAAIVGLGLGSGLGNSVLLVLDHARSRSWQTPVRDPDSPSTIFDLAVGTSRPTTGPSFSVL